MSKFQGKPMMTKNPLVGPKAEVQKPTQSQVPPKKTGLFQNPFVKKSAVPSAAPPKATASAKVGNATAVTQDVQPTIPPVNEETLDAVIADDSQQVPEVESAATVEATVPAPTKVDEVVEIPPAPVTQSVTQGFIVPSPTSAVAQVEPPPPTDEYEFDDE
jgi:hypothetical protein